MPNDLKRHWRLDPSITFLNHGSFGACPTPVLAVQQSLRDEMEREPPHFFMRTAPRLLDAARESLARFLGCDSEGLAFVPNATTGVNSVLRSLPLEAGDELLVTDHEYNACRNVLDYVAQDRGCRVVVARIPFPTSSPSEVCEALLSAVSPATRLALVDHVTSASGMIFPIGEIAQALTQREVPLLVDGAHAPGMVPLKLGELGATYYTGNCHKWLCAPKGAGFLWVAPTERHRVRPAIISHGANAPTDERSRFRNEFDWLGTRDLTPYLSVPTALEFMEGLLPGGWTELMSSNRGLALEARRLLSDLLGARSLCPEEMIGSLASLPVPAEAGASAASGSALDRDRLQERLFEHHRIEVVVSRGPGPTGRLLRISAQIYNQRSDYEHLASALRTELAL